MTTWKLINSFIQPKLLLLFISVTLPNPSLYLPFSLFSLSLSPICHKFILLHLTSSLVPELPINHCCCLTLSIFPETQGGCCRNWVRHNLQGSRAWLVMILLGNVAISTQWEIGGMGRRGWGGCWCWCWWSGGSLVDDMTPKKSCQMTQFYRSPSTTGHLDLCVCVCLHVCLEMSMRLQYCVSLCRLVFFCICMDRIVMN